MQDPETEKMGIRLKNLRIAKGLSQQSLADLLDTSAANISRYENEGFNLINVRLINKLSAVFRVSQAYLLGFTDDPTPTYLGDLPTIDKIGLEYGIEAKETLQYLLRANQNGKFLLVQMAKAFATSSVYSSNRSVLDAAANNLYLQEEQAKLKK